MQQQWTSFPNCEFVEECTVGEVSSSYVSPEIEYKTGPAVVSTTIPCHHQCRQ